MNAKKDRGTSRIAVDDKIQIDDIRCAKHKSFMIGVAQFAPKKNEQIEEKIG
jgi:hypothetical protein